MTTAAAIGLSLLVLTSALPVAPRFLTGASEGTRFLLPLAAGAAFLLIALAASMRRLAAGAWAALAFLAQGAALELVRAGPAVGYQHYPEPAALATHAGARAVIVLAVVAGLVVVGTVRNRRRTADFLLSHSRPASLALAAVLVVLTSATLSSDPGTYGAELLVATAIEVVILGTVVLAAQALPTSTARALAARVDDLVGVAGSAEGGARWLIPVVAVWAFALSALLAIVSYGMHPHVPDEVSYLLQARYFAEGWLSMPAPPVPDAFEINLMALANGRWYSPFPPGWPAVLALGVLAGVRWLVNPMLAALTIPLVYALVRRVYDPRTARLTVVLLAVSPWFLFTGMSFMAHTVALLFATAAALALAIGLSTGAWTWPVLAGACAGLLGLVRPLEGAIVIGLLGLWSLTARTGVRRRLQPAFLAAVGFGLVSLANLPYNRVFTGDPLRFPVMDYMEAEFGPGSNALGFGPERGAGWELDPLPGHAPLDALINTNQNLFQINTELLGWGSGSLLLLLLFVFSVRPSRPDLAMLSSIGAVAGVHGLYWFSGGPDFGARYWYLAIVPCAALTARALDWLGAERRGGTHRQGRVFAPALLLSLAALTLFVPWRALDKYRDYRGMRPEIRDIAADPELREALVLVRGRRPDYASAAVYNPLRLEGPGPIFAWYRDGLDLEALRTAFPGRALHVLDGPSVTGNGYSFDPAADLNR